MPPICCVTPSTDPCGGAFPAAVGVGKGMHHIRLLAEVADHAPALPVVDNKLPMLLIDQQPPYQLHQVR
jgi:hypothetical protein